MARWVDSYAVEDGMAGPRVGLLELESGSTVLLVV